MSHPWVKVAMVSRTPQFTTLGKGVQVKLADPLIGPLLCYAMEVRTLCKQFFEQLSLFA